MHVCMFACMYAFFMFTSAHMESNADGPADQHFPSACAAALARPVLISQELGDAPGQVGGTSQWPDQYHQHVGAVVDSIRPRWHTEQLELINAIIAERAADAVDDVRIPRPPLAPVALHPCAKGTHHGRCKREGFGVHCRSARSAISYGP